MADRREQVFVSSTYLDLRDERQSVIQALLIAGCIPAGMELFTAGNEQKWRLIQRVINECDYYVLVIGGKYGSIDPVSDLGYTEMEYDYADSIGKPIMAFLHGEPGQLKGDQLELDADRRGRLQAFREKVEAARVVRYWTNPSEIQGHVALALMETRDHFPAEGWIRAGQAMTPEVRTELAELRARVAELTQAAGDNARRSPTATEDLAQGDDEYEFSVQFRGYDKSGLRADGEPRLDADVFLWNVGVPFSWNDILQTVGPSLLHEASEPELFKTLDNWVQTRQLTDERAPKDLRRRTDRPRLTADAVEDVVVQFFALGLIERGTKKRTVSDRGKYWKLTAFGEDQMMKLRAIRR